jgi:hypothetical protein
MLYAHLTDQTVDAVGQPPQLLFFDSRWWDLRTRDVATLALVGWLPVAESARPADTATITWDVSYVLAGGTVDQVWMQRAKTAEELTADLEESNRQTIEAGLADALATLQVIVDDTNANINASPASRIKDMARTQRRVIRLLIRRFDGTT